tara:strand:+ start:1138 stop:1413 length:276 start_codon:yes stop_codon:yes gene_type:complete
MSYKVKKIAVDESNFGYAISDDVTFDGSMFDLSSSDLTLRADYNQGVGLFDVDLNSIIAGATSDDLIPTNSSDRTDIYFEIDDDGNLTPKS